jgi:hypothetical protein
MLHSYGFKAGNEIHVWMLDLSTTPPKRLAMHYAYGAEAFERDPARWKPEEMPAAEHQAAVEAHQRRRPRAASQQQEDVNHDRGHQAQAADRGVSEQGGGQPQRQ